MKLRDCTEIAAWAGISAVIGLAAFGGRTAISDGAAPAPAQPTAAVGACHVTAKASAAHGLGSANVKLSIANPGTKTETVTFDVDIVSRQFVGSPVSRVASPNDFRTTTIEHRQISRTIAPSTIMPVAYVVPHTSFAPKTESVTNTLSKPRTTLISATSQPLRVSTPAVYEVVVKAAGKQTLLTTFNMQGA